MFKRIGIVLTLIAAIGVVTLAQTTSSHTVVGEIKKVDREAGHIVVKTAEGTEETIKFTGKTAVHGVKDAGKATAWTGKEGSHVVVHYVGEGAEKTAIGVEHVGKDAPKVVEGAVVGTGKLAKTIVVKTPAGAKETLHLTERATVDTGKGVVKCTEYTAKEGEHVTVHYTEVGGRKVAHLVKRIV
jgi:hypothetical protein